MDENLFSELVQSVKEMKAIERGELRPARATTVEIPDAKTVRESLGLSQAEFAALLDVSKHTLVSWEQGKRNPSGPARTLLLVTQKYPEAVLEAVQGR